MLKHQLVKFLYHYFGLHPLFDKKTKKVTKVTLNAKKICNSLFSLSLSSALRVLTSVFGMGTGVSPLLSLQI